ncbi:MAG TPA: peptide ABC transporter substrate-binding protein [Candidatus Binatus sp.]|nr:peptide ABC transporter substrate-binding protein [Candidatus Binatus sp.]
MTGALSAACSKISTQVIKNGQTGSGTIPGTLRYADIEEPTSLNPLLRLDAVSTDQDMFVFGFFFNLDDKEHWVPELATEVPTYQNGGISKDGLTITYHLRHGVKWQDGQPFTAHDCVFTEHAIMNPANDVVSRSGWDQIASVAAPDPYTFVIHLKRIYAPAIASYFAVSGEYPVLPAHLLEKYPDMNHVPFNTHPIGTGPFKFVKWIHGDHIEWVANPDYWRGPPKLKRIIYHIIPNDQTILTQLQTHELDAWFRAPSSLISEFKDLHGFRVELTPTNAFAHIDFSFKNPIFDDVRVRQAINYAIDKKLLIHNVTHDVDVPGYSDQPSFSWAYDPDVEHYDFDPAKAAELLDEAGWKLGPGGVRVKDGQRLAFNLSTVAGGTTGVLAETYVQQMLKKAGIDAGVKNYPTALFFADYQQGGILQTGKYDMAFFSWVAGVDPDDKSLYACASIPPNGQNDMYWCDPKIDATENLALSTYDQNVRKKYYLAIQKMLTTDSPTIFTWYVRSISVTSLNFQNFKPAPAVTSNWNTWEWEMK